MKASGGRSLTYVLAVHVVEEAEAVGGRVGDAVRVFGGDVEERTYEPRLVAVVARPRRLNVHVETFKHRNTEKHVRHACIWTQVDHFNTFRGHSSRFRRHLSRFSVDPDTFEL